MTRQNFINRGQRLSPSSRKIIKLRQRAFQNGGASLELQIPTNYIRDISRKLNYNILSDASLVMTPNTIGESRLFNLHPGLSNSDFQATRATTATVVRKDGSIGDSCYNLFSFSEDFTNALWVKEALTVTANSTANPINGLNTATKITGDRNTSNSFTRIRQSPTINNGTYNFNAFYKAAEFNFVHLRLSNTQPQNIGICVNLTTGEITQGKYDGTLSSSFPSSYSTKLLTNGWVYVEFTMNITSTGNNFYTYISNSSTSTALINQLGSGVYIFGAQLVSGAQPKDYLKTTNRLNVPSIDYSLGSDKPALLVDPQRTNLITFSQDFGNSIWTSFNATKSVISGSTSPTSTSYFFNDGSASGVNHYIYHNGGSTYTSGNTYTASFFVKKAVHSYIQIGFTTSFDSANPGYAIFNFDSEIFTNSQNIINSGVEKLIDGWYRISITKTAALTNNASAIFVASTNNTNSFLPTYTGTNSNYVQIGGCQFELGSNATSYIPTTTATVTRNAYTSYVDMFNNSLFNKDNFTLFIEGYIDFRHSLNPWIGFSDSSTLFTGNSLYLYNGNALGYYVGGARTDIALTTSDKVYFKTVIKKSGTSLKIFSDGVLKVTDTLATFDYRYLILNDGSARNFVQKIALWKRTLSDADCVLLTT